MSVALTQPETPIKSASSQVNIVGFVKADGTVVAANADNPLPVAAMLDQTGLATSAKQDTLITALQATQAAAEKVIPATLAVAVTPSDATVLSATRALFVGTGGDVAVTMAGGGDVTFTNVPDGTTLPISVTKVLATGTTASDIVAMR